MIINKQTSLVIQSHSSYCNNKHLLERCSDLYTNPCADGLQTHTHTQMEVQGIMGRVRAVLAPCMRAREALNADFSPDGFIKISALVYLLGLHHIILIVNVHLSTIIQTSDLFLTMQSCIVVRCINNTQTLHYVFQTH